jgi:aspartyl protease family protein
MLRSVVLIAGVSVAAAAYAPDFMNSRLQPPAPKPAAMNISAPEPEVHYGSGSVRLDADRGGHYHAEFEVNGLPLDAMVDTGASLVVLRYEDARWLGLVYGGDRFDIPVQTAHGVAYVRRVKLNSVRIGSIALDDVDALVAEDGMLSTNLIGMSFLSRLSRFEARNGMLVLER